MKRKILITSLLICLVTVCFAAIADLSGKWAGSIKGTDGNDHALHLVFKAEGDKLTGTAQSDQGDPLTINEGKVTGNDFTFKVTDPEGNTIPVDGKYIAAGDSVSMNFVESSVKFHVTLKREN
jgi:hypothetical protein